VQHATIRSAVNFGCSRDGLQPGTSLAADAGKLVQILDKQAAGP
jgi:hypothetical protein